MDLNISFGTKKNTFTNSVFCGIICGNLRPEARASLNQKVEGKKPKRKDNRYHKTKDKLVETFGGKCGICGYNKWNRALHFHHLDPTQKDIEISKLITQKKPWSMILKEAHKCILVCANCHSELHEKS